jgi:tetratricopeptide (TPR) repeat protein
MKHRFTLLTMVLFTLSFNPHIEAHDSRSQNYFDLGFNHLRQQRYEDGARMFRAAISHERRGDAYYYLAICEMKQNQFEKALSSLGKGLNLSDRP